MTGLIIDFPNVASLRRLVLSESGFVFDPVTGCSFSTNPTGLLIFHLIQQTQDVQQIVQRLQNEFKIDTYVVERDVIEFVGLLRKFFL